MKAFYTILAMFWAGQAVAHPGHLAEAAGHDHWVAGIAIGAAIALGLWAGLKAKGAAEAEPEEAEEAAEEELQEA